MILWITWLLQWLFSDCEAGQEVFQDAGPTSGSLGRPAGFRTIRLGMGSDWIEPIGNDLDVRLGTTLRTMLFMMVDHQIWANSADFPWFSHPTLDSGKMKLGPLGLLNFFVRKCAFPSNWPMLGGGNSFFPCGSVRTHFNSSSSQGPKFRVGELQGEPVMLKEGEIVEFGICKEIRG